MRRRVAALALLGLLAARAAAEDSAELLAALRAQWKSGSEEHKLTELEKLELVADAAALEQSLLWLKNADPAVAGGLIRLIGACARREKLRDLTSIKQSPSNHMVSAWKQTRLPGHVELNEGPKA